MFHAKLSRGHRNSFAFQFLIQLVFTVLKSCLFLETTKSISALGSMEKSDRERERGRKIVCASNVKSVNSNARAHPQWKIIKNNNSSIPFLEFIYISSIQLIIIHHETFNKNFQFS